jgi:membrane-associated protease RseP (regulator of RpoE activity)
MNSRKLILSLAVALAAPVATTVTATNPPQPAMPVQVQHAGGFLGVLLGPVPESVRMQLGGVLPAGQGVMIRNVEANSPAAKAGLKVYDILLGYDNQRLFSAEQLSRLIRVESPNKQATLQLVRGGKTSEVQVTLGQAQTAPDVGPAGWGMPWMPPMGHYQRPYPPFYPPFSKEEGDHWKRFDSLSLNKLQDGSFRAEIQFLTKEGKLVKQQFTGSREEIRDQIMQQHDLPSIERNQLLSTLSARNGFFSPEDRVTQPFSMPPWFNWQPDF